MPSQPVLVYRMSVKASRASTEYEVNLLVKKSTSGAVRSKAGFYLTYLWLLSLRLGFNGVVRIVCYHHVRNHHRYLFLLTIIVKITNIFD